VSPAAAVGTDSDRYIWLDTENRALSTFDLQNEFGPTRLLLYLRTVNFKQHLTRLKPQIFTGFLNPLREALKNKDISRLKVYIAFQQGDKDEIRTAKVSLQRASAEGWELGFEDSQLETEDTVTSDTLVDRLSKISHRADAYAVQHGPDNEWKVLVDAIEEYSAEGQHARDLEYAEIGRRACLGDGYHSHLMAPAIAKAYCLEATAALKKSNVQYAARLIKRAEYWISERFLIESPREKYRERAAVGGRAKAKLSSQVKLRAAELLRTNMPEGGWPSRAAATQAVAATLMSEDEKMVFSAGLLPENLPIRIGEWIERHPNDFVLILRGRKS